MSTANGPRKTIKIEKVKTHSCDYCDKGFEYYVNFFNHKIDTGYVPGYALRAPLLSRRACACHLYQAVEDAYDEAYEHRDK